MAKKKEIGLLESGFYGLVASSMFHVFVPGFIPFVTGGLSVVALGMHFLDTTGSKSTLDEFFLNTRLFVGTQDTIKLPKLLEVHEKLYGHCYVCKLPPGLSSEDIAQKKLALKEYLGAKAIEIDFQNKVLLIRVIENVKKIYNFQNHKIVGKDIIEAPLGYTNSGQLKTFRLNTQEHAALVGGCSGSGKSNALKSILTWLIMNRTTSQLKLHLIDMKRSEFHIFKNVKHVENYASDLDSANRLLKNLISLVEERYELFEKHEVFSIEDYNRKFPNKKMSYHLLVVDEYVDFMIYKQSDAIDMIRSIAQKSRSCGVCMVLSMQKISSKVLDSFIKANCPVVIGFRVQNKYDSMTLLDRSGLEKELEGVGECIYLEKGREYKLQTQKMPDDAQEIKQLLKDYYVKEQPNSKKVIPINQKKKEVGLITDDDWGIF